MRTTIFSSRPILSILAGLTLAATACTGIRGEGDLLTENRNHSGFHAVEISVPGHVEVHTDTVWKVRVQAEETIMPYLETEVVNGKLKVFFSRTVNDVDGLEVVISGPNFDEFNLSGSGTLVCHDPIQGQQLQAFVSGSGEMTLSEVQFTEIETHVSGSGEVYIGGAADKLQAHVSGSGDINLLDCPVKTADVHVSGSGDIRCHVSQHLEAHVSGSGDVLYRGNPTLDVRISGSGEVKKI